MSEKKKVSTLSKKEKLLAEIKARQDKLAKLKEQEIQESGKLAVKVGLNEFELDTQEKAFQIAKIAIDHNLHEISLDDLSSRFSAIK